jgi:membrane-associated protease RseP (regulator of RpoE activity)
MEKNNATVLLIVVGVLALLVGCTFGVLVGGAAAYMISSTVTESSVIEPPVEPPLRITPQYKVPGIPMTPVMPDRMGSVYALVTVVTPGSPAERGGIQVGDMITRFDGEELQDEGPVTMITAYEPGDRIIVTVQRGTDELELDVTLGENPNAPGSAWLGITYQAISGDMERFMRPDRE